MFAYFKSTRFKMTMAHMVFIILRLLQVKPKRIIRRKGVNFEVNLVEGIDLSLFLFGGFQKHVTHNKRVHLPNDAVIFDIGANIGSFSLFLARQYPNAVIFAFEPTHYAFTKLKRNIALNEKQLGERVVPIQSFVSSAETSSEPLTAYASWPIRRLDGNRHPVHLGISKRTTEKQMTIDRFVARQNIKRLDLIKIDTDGHELDVLKGSTEVIRRFKPIIVFELTRYLLKERNQTFGEYEKLLLPHDYTLLDAHSYRKVHKNNLEQRIPKGGGIDVLAIPS